MKFITIDNPLLIDLLTIAVPQHIDTMKQRGGPSDQDLRGASEFGLVLAAQGDDLMFRSKEKGKTAKLFNGLAFALAVAAFAPEGITFAGEHYEASV